MALGVLNNLSAIYAENNLNNTNNSLQTVLQQLSSGSRINSGADDAAGLSLVNGLEANQTALMQSGTNAVEGVGLLEVADGALSQVTSMLDRAITLATEASNGTLNSTQEGAANNEYQSILAEVNNIGSTTTYNQQTVFNGSTVAIYTGDSSTAGSSVDNLSIRTLSSASIGDTDGTMSYSSGQSNVFIDLSNSGHNAAETDSLNSNGATTINVSYLTKTSGAATASTAAISVGLGTSYANTVQGLISAINNDGLGLSATFGTAASAGAAAAATALTANNGGGTTSDTGIIVSGAGIGAGTNGAGVVGALSLAQGDTLGGTLTIVGSDGASHNLTLGTANSTDTLANLEATINAANYGVTATLNQAGTQLTFTSADSMVTVSASNLTQNSAPTSQTITVAGSGLGSLTVGNSSDTLQGTLKIVEGVDQSATTTPLVLGGQTLLQLETTIDSGNYGIDAELSPNGTTLTFTKLASDQGTPAISVQGGSSITDVATPNVAQGTTLGTLAVASASDNLTSGSLDMVSGITGAAATPIAIGTPGVSDTLNNLANTINAGGYGITATLDPTNTVLTFTQNSGDTHAAAIGSAVGGINDATYATQPATFNHTGLTLGQISVAESGDRVSVAGGGANDGLVIKGNGTTEATIDLTSTGGETLQTMATTINATTGTTGITATLNAAHTTLTFTEANGTAGAAVYIGTAGAVAAPADVVTDNVSAAHSSAVFTQAANLGSLTATTVGDTFAGEFTITEGANSKETPYSLDFSDQTLAQIQADFDTTTGTDNWSTYGISATLSGNQQTLKFSQSSGDLGTASLTNNGAIIDNSAALNSNPNVSVQPSVGKLGTLTSLTPQDYLSGTLEVTNSAGVISPYTFTGQTLSEIADSFNRPPDGQNDTSGITATYNAVTNVLAFTGSGPNAVSGLNIQDMTPSSTTNQIVAPGTILNTLTVANKSDVVYGTFDITSGTTGLAANHIFTLGNGQTLQNIADDFNGAVGAFVNLQADGITATVSPNGTSLVFSQTDGDTDTANIQNDIASPILDQTNAAATPQIPVTAITGAIEGGGGHANVLGVGAAGDTLTGTLSITEGIDTNQTASTFNLSGQTLAQIAADFNTATGSQNLSDLGITAVLNNANASLATAVTFIATPGDLGAGNANVIESTVIVDQNATPSNVTINTAAGAMQDTLGVIGTADLLSGSLKINSGFGGASTLQLGTTGFTDTLADLAKDFTTGAEKNLGIAATLNQAGTQLTFTQTSGGFAASVVGSTITDSDITNIAPSGSLGSLTVNTASDLLSGTLSGVEGNGTISYTIPLGNTGSTDTLQDLAQTINVTDAQYGITAKLSQNGTVLSFSATAGDTGTPTLANVGSITDETPGVETSISLTKTPVNGSTAITTLGSLTIPLTDTLSGILAIGNNTIAIGSTQNNAALLTAAINEGDYGVTAAYDPSTGVMTFASANPAMTVNTTNLDATVLHGSNASGVGALTGGPTTASNYYSIGISGNITDSSTAVVANSVTTYGGTANVGITVDANAAGGTATMGYSDAAGQSLSGTDLLTQAHAESALNELNVAITDAAAMDGYIGAQINTLNSVGQVMTTQQDNVVSAQNAIQATDYASATSNMSKYEILSQTGIAALAQANTVQQEVTKLLQ